MSVLTKIGARPVTQKLPRGGPRRAIVDFKKERAQQQSLAIISI
jgi:hypothetical protein